MTAAQCIAERRKAVKDRRYKYGRRSSEKQSARLARKIEAEKARAARKGLKRP